MKFSNYLSLAAGVFLAAISLYFSSTGLVHLFSGAGSAIIVMAIAFELAKLSGVTWIIRNGRRSVLTAAMGLALTCLVGISSLGVYGFLGRSYAAGRTESVGASTTIASLSATVTSLESDKDRLYKLIEAVPANQGSNRRRIQAQTQPRIDRLDRVLRAKRDSLAVAQSHQVTVSNDIGDLRFAAELFGTSQEGLAKLIITVLAFLLDPLAVMLVLASGVKGKRAEEIQFEQKERYPAHHIGIVGEGLSEAPSTRTVTLLSSDKKPDDIFKPLKTETLDWNPEAFADESDLPDHITQEFAIPEPVVVQDYDAVPELGTMAASEPVPFTPLQEVGFETMRTNMRKRKRELPPVSPALRQVLERRRG
jgi:hypothetical protein